MKKKILNYSMTILAIVIFAFSVYIMIFGTIAKKNNTLLSVFGYSSPAVVTPSMAGDKPDSFDAGAILITKNIKFENINIGDIIVFQSEDMLKVHRVVHINEDGSLVTKGDANGSNDPGAVTEETYQAKVLKSFSFFGLGKKLPGYQLPILGLVIIALIIYVFVQVFQIIIALKNKKLDELRKSYNSEK